MSDDIDKAHDDHSDCNVGECPFATPEAPEHGLSDPLRCANAECDAYRQAYHAHCADHVENGPQDPLPEERLSVLTRCHTCGHESRWSDAVHWSNRPCGKVDCGGRMVTIPEDGFQTCGNCHKGIVYNTEWKPSPCTCTTTCKHEGPEYHAAIKRGDYSTALLLQCDDCPNTHEEGATPCLCAEVTQYNCPRHGKNAEELRHAR